MTLLSQLSRTVAQHTEKREATAIVRLLLSCGLGWTDTEIFTKTYDELTIEEHAIVDKYMKQLCEERIPVQYILGRALFMDREFAVAPGVLIPRPETSELVQLVLDNLQNPSSKIIDIGTGSGCIAITLALALPAANVEAWDISEKALEIAQSNASRFEARVAFVLQDACTQSHTISNSATERTIIVSNPPYILPSESTDMQPEVLSAEPHEALFVSEEEPLKIVKAIARMAADEVYLEYNPLLIDQANEILKGKIINDSFGKRRFIVAKR